jgi:hypothetical protein
MNDGERKEYLLQLLHDIAGSWTQNCNVWGLPTFHKNKRFFSHFWAILSSSEIDLNKKNIVFFPK